MKRFWFVMVDESIANRQCVGGIPTYRHPTHESARTEAARLANVNPGKRFLVLEVVAACEVNATRWIELESDGNEMPY